MSDKTIKYIYVLHSDDVVAGMFSTEERLKEAQERVMNGPWPTYKYKLDVLFE